MSEENRERIVKLEMQVEDITNWVKKKIEQDKADEDG